MKLVSSLAVLAGLAQAGNVPYTNCGTSADLLQKVTVAANPYPPVPGKAVDLDIQGQLSAAVQSGAYTLSVSYDGITIITKTGDLKSLTTLPVAAGPLKVSKSENLPSSIPSGKYVAKLQATANGGKPLFCADLDLSIGADVAEPEEDLVTTGKTAPFKVLHALIEKAGAAEKGFKAGFELEIGAEAEAHLGLGGGIGVDAADGDAVQKAGEGSFNGAETVKNLALLVGGGGDLDIKIAVGAKLKFGVAAGEATAGEEVKGVGIYK